jgi:hypothetical protein
MLSHYLCSSADKAEGAQASLRAHGYVDAIWDRACGRRLLLVPHADAYVERVDHLVYRTDPAAQWVGPAMERTAAHVRRVTVSVDADAQERVSPDLSADDGPAMALGKVAVTGCKRRHSPAAPCTTDVARQ